MHLCDFCLHSGGLLSEEVFIHYLGITMSAGWTHFMVFNKQLREIILRKPKDPEEPAAANLKERGAKRLDGEPATEDEVRQFVFDVMSAHRTQFHHAAPAEFAAEMSSL